MIQRAEQLAKAAPYDVNTSFQHLVEEVGEVGTVLNVQTTGRKKLDEDIFGECADVINCALEVFFKSGGTIDLLKERLIHKQNKWEASQCRLTSQ